MLEVIALVVKSDPNEIDVETEVCSSCVHCSKSSHCGTSELAKLFSARRNQVQLKNTLGAKTGEKVIIGMPDELLVRAAILAYLLPLLLMIFMTILANATGVSEAYQSLFGLCGLIIGFIFVRWKTSGGALQDYFKPRLLRMADQSVVIFK